MTDLVLAWVNGQRQALGADPLPALPTGKPGDPDNCVISNCFKDVIGRCWADYDEFKDDGVVTIFQPLDYGDTVPVIREVNQGVAGFMKGFDEKKYPELVA